MMKRIFGILLLLAILAGGYQFWREASYGTEPGATPDAGAGNMREVAVVANSVAGSVSLIDVADRKLLSTFSIVPDGKSVGFFRDPLQFFAQGYIEERAGLNYAQDSDLSPDGRTLYVSRGLLGDVVAINLATQKIIWRTAVAGFRADHMDISPDGRHLFVSAIIYGGNVVHVIDAATGDIVDDYLTGNWPHDVHVSNDGKTLHVASIGDMTQPVKERDEDSRSYILTIIDLEPGRIDRELTFSNGIRPFQISSDGKTLFGQQSNTHDIFMHDITQDKSLDRISLPIADGVSEADWDFEAPHHGLALAGSGELLCAAGRASDYAAIVRTAPLALVKTVPVGDAPSWSAITSDDQYCLTANTRDDSVSIVSMSSAEEVKRISVGRAAKHITIGMIPDDVIAELPAPPGS